MKTSGKRRLKGRKSTKANMCGTTARPKARLTKARAKAQVRWRIEHGAAIGRVRSYPCDFCGTWHTGTRMPADMRNRRRSGR